MIALLALVVALTPPAYAALAKNSVGTPQLKQGAVTSVKVRNNNLRPVDLVRRARLDRVVFRRITAVPGGVVPTTNQGTLIGSLTSQGSSALVLPGPSRLLVTGGVSLNNVTGNTRIIFCGVTINGTSVAYETQAYLQNFSGTSIPVTASVHRPAGTYDVGVVCRSNGVGAGNLYVSVMAVPR